MVNNNKIRTFMISGTEIRLELSPFSYKLSSSGDITFLSAFAGFCDGVIEKSFGEKIYSLFPGFLEALESLAVDFGVCLLCRDTRSKNATILKRQK